MTKVENLYAEQIINESPYYYDESGRLRVKTINESAPMRRPLPIEDEKPKEPAGPDRPKEVKLVGKKPLPVQGEPVPVKGGTAFLPKPPPAGGGLTAKIGSLTWARKNKDVGLGGLDDGSLRRKAQLNKLNQLKKPSGGTMRTADMQDRPSKDVGLGRLRKLPKDAPVEPSEGGGLTSKKRFDMRGGMGGPKYLPAPVEPSGGMMRTADMQDSNNDGTDDRDQRPSAQPQKKQIKQDLRSLKDQKRQMKMSGQKPGAALKGKIMDAKAKLGAGKGKMKPQRDEDLPAVDVKPKPKAKFLSKFRSQRDTGKNVNTRAGLRNARGLREDVVDSVFEKLRLVQAAPATDYLEERMNLKKASMGEVIKDFRESDAPQFKGKSKAKRRQMAIAAKLEADRG